MSTIRQDIERDYALRKIRKPARVLKADDTGLHFKEAGTGNNIVYCPNCKGPVVDSYRARLEHAYNMPKCARAIAEAE